MSCKFLTTAIDSAWQFWSMGFSVIPVHYGEKDAKYRWAQYQKRHPQESELARWVRIPSNFAVLTGPYPIEGDYPGLVVIDFDNMPDYEQWQAWARVNNPEITKGYQVKTRRGVHVYLLSDSAGAIRNLHYDLIECIDGLESKRGVDVKGAGGYVMLAGSLHPTGFVYEAMEAENCHFPEFERLEEVMPPEILGRYIEPDYQASAPHTEPGIEDILNRPVSGKGAGMSVEDVKRGRKIQELIRPEQWTGNGFYVAKCPFHDDKVASFWADTKKEICGCFAGCHGTRPWDVVNLYAKLHGVSNSQALAELANGK